MDDNNRVPKKPDQEEECGDVNKGDAMNHNGKKYGTDPSGDGPELEPAFPFLNQTRMLKYGTTVIIGGMRKINGVEDVKEGKGETPANIIDDVD